MTDQPEIDQIDHETPDQREELSQGLKVLVAKAVAGGSLDVNALEKEQFAEPRLGTTRRKRQDERRIRCKPTS